MSYCRWGKDSDVYVFVTELGDGPEPETWWVCFECSIAREHDREDLYAPNLASLRHHLEAHREQGHKVPDYAFERIDREMAAGTE